MNRTQSSSATKSVLGRVCNSCMLVLRLCCVMVTSQHVVDTDQSSAQSCDSKQWSMAYE